MQPFPAPANYFSFPPPPYPPQQHMQAAIPYYYPQLGFQNSIAPRVPIHFIPRFQKPSVIEILDSDQEQDVQVIAQTSKTQPIIKQKKQIPKKNFHQENFKTIDLDMLIEKKQLFDEGDVSESDEGQLQIAERKKFKSSEGIEELVHKNESENVLNVNCQSRQLLGRKRRISNLQKMNDCNYAEDFLLTTKRKIIKRQW